MAIQVKMLFTLLRLGKEAETRRRIHQRQGTLAQRVENKNNVAKQQPL